MSSTIDQQFVEFIVKSLVGNPDGVNVTRSVDEKGVLLELTVDQEDLGRVIGKRGATAQSLRTLLRALGTKNDARYNLKIVDPNEDESRSSSQVSTTVTVSDNDDSEEQESDVISKTRKELDDLDDLDI
ncbi:MAG: KH domain-containing protein [Candidatus Saccharimonadales bacterium]